MKLYEQKFVGDTPKEAAKNSTGWVKRFAFVRVRMTDGNVIWMEPYYQYIVYEWNESHQCFNKYFKEKARAQYFVKENAKKGLRNLRKKDVAEFDMKSRLQG